MSYKTDLACPAWHRSGEQTMAAVLGHNPEATLKDANCGEPVSVSVHQGPTIQKESL